MEKLLLLAWLTTHGAFPEATTRMVGGRVVDRADVTIQQALGYVGQRLDPIEVVDRREAARLYSRIPGAPAPSPGMVAFRLPGGWQSSWIFVNRESDVYRKAAGRPGALTLLRLAAVLVHEQVHATDGEHAAYRLQADFVRSRLEGLSWRERVAAEDHLEELEARTLTFQRIEELARRAPRRPAL